MSPDTFKSLFLQWNIIAIGLVFLALVQRAAALPAGPIVTTVPNTGNLTVFDPTTLQPIPQFPATDGGSGMLNKIIWALFGILVGAPLGVVGVRAGRIATGVAVGFVGVVSGEPAGCMRARVCSFICSACLVWAAFVNALPMPLASTPNTADLILTVILITSFIFFTFLGAFLRWMHPLGLGLLGGCLADV
jgi:hypothetical protein